MFDVVTIKKNVYGCISEGIIKMIHHLSCSIRGIKIRLPISRSNIKPSECTKFGLACFYIQSKTKSGESD